MGCSALKPRMRLAEDTKAVMRLAEERPASSMQYAQELIRDLQRAAAAQGERLRRAEQELASTRGRLGAVTRKLAEKEAAAERARSQAEESKDAEIERLRADHQALRQGQEEAAQVRAQLVTASMEASATAQRARELEQRIKELENATVSTSVSPERRSRAPPSAPAGSPESAGSSRESSSEACSTLGSVSWAPTSVGAPDTQAESHLTALAQSALCALRAESAAAEAALRAELAAARERADCAAAEADSLRRLLDVEREAAALPGAEERQRSEVAAQWLAELQGQQLPGDVPLQAAEVQGPELHGEAGGARRRRRKRGKKGAQDAVRTAPERNPEHTWQFVLSIETVCHRMAEFIPFEWAQLSCMAPMVHEVVGTWVNYWGYGAINYCWHMQSAEYGVDVHGPSDLGLPGQAQRDLIPFHAQLRREIRLRGPDVELQRRLLRRVEMVRYIFDEFRIRFADLFEEVNPFFQSMLAFHTNLGDALRSREARVGAAAAAAD